jgi:MYXO-CTERM domain-containing protein
VALTTLTYRKDTGELLDADMEVNATLKLIAQDPIPRDGFDLLTVFTHEAGHFLGLAHSDTPKATMFASYDPGTVDQRTQKQDDVDGICAAYPPDGKRPTAAGAVAAEACDPRKTPSVESGSGSSSGCSAAPPASFAGGASGATALLALGLATVLRRRLRRA